MSKGQVTKNNILYRLKRRITWILQGRSIKDKVKLILFSIFWWLCHVRPPLISQYLHQIANIVVRGAIIYYRGSQYRLIDAATAYYFSGESHEAWMWNYLKPLKDDDVFVDVGAHIGLYSIHAGSYLKTRQSYRD